jgi:hypothetical protein
MRAQLPLATWPLLLTYSNCTKGVSGLVERTNTGGCQFSSNV